MGQIIFAVVMVVLSVVLVVLNALFSDLGVMNYIAIALCATSALVWTLATFQRIRDYRAEKKRLAAAEGRELLQEGLADFRAGRVTGPVAVEDLPLAPDDARK